MVNVTHGASRPVHPFHCSCIPSDIEIWKCSIRLESTNNRKSKQQRSVLLTRSLKSDFKNNFSRLLLLLLRNFLVSWSQHPFNPGEPLHGVTRPFSYFTTLICQLQHRHGHKIVLRQAYFITWGVLLAKVLVKTDVSREESMIRKSIFPATVPRCSHRQREK